MKNWFKQLGWVLALVGGLALVSACNDSGGDSGSTPKDFGDNDPGLVVAMGDSITEGQCVPAGAPWPSRLAGLSGKGVINEGRCGERSAGGASRIAGVLSRTKPGYVLINYGANDAIYGHTSGTLTYHIRVMIQAAKANNTVPLVGTVLPMYDSHAFAADKVPEYNAAIKQVCKEEGVRVVDVNKEFGNERSFLQGDGLHPSDSGNQLIALSFNDKL